MALCIHTDPDTNESSVVGTIQLAVGFMPDRVEPDKLGPLLKHLDTLPCNDPESRYGPMRTAIELDIDEKFKRAAFCFSRMWNNAIIQGVKERCFEDNDKFFMLINQLAKFNIEDDFLLDMDPEQSHVSPLAVSAFYSWIEYGCNAFDKHAAIERQIDILEFDIQDKRRAKKAVSNAYLFKKLFVNNNQTNENLSGIWDKLYGTFHPSD